MQETEGYPYSLKSVLQQNQFENILDSNIFSAYIPRELPIPRIDDPRKTQVSQQGVARHPGYVRSAQINQIFNYIGFIKRAENRKYKEYLPMLFRELNRFLKVLEEIVFTLDVTISEEIYVEQKNGLKNFLASYNRQPHHGIEWIEKIWKQQKIYLENIDMLIETLKVSGRVFDFNEESLYKTIITFCKNIFNYNSSEDPADNDLNFVANCCLKAARDNEPKTIWSGDMYICKILRLLYNTSDLKKEFPQIYLRASYDPLNYTQLFP